MGWDAESWLENILPRRQGLPITSAVKLRPAEVTREQARVGIRKALGDRFVAVPYQGGQLLFDTIHMSAFLSERLAVFLPEAVRRITTRLNRCRPEVTGDRPGSLPAPILAEDTKLSQETIVKWLKRLVAEGIVEQVPCRKYVRFSECYQLTDAVVQEIRSGENAFMLGLAPARQVI